jgi:hypothetical protein
MRHFLNDIEISPRNVLEIGLNSDFTGRPENLELSADRIILPREGLTIIQNHISTQGIFEGVPYRIETETGESLEYYVDLTENAVFKTYEIEVSIKRRNGKDNFFDNADGLSFELMASKGVQFNFIDVPYLIIKDNSVELAISLGISIYVLSREIITQVQALTDTIGQIFDATLPDIGIPPSFDSAGIVMLVIQATTQIIVIGLLIFALIKLSQQFFELIFPKIRYYQGAKVKELISKGCQHLGYSFESNLLDGISGLTILPVPLIKEKTSIWDEIENDLNFAFTKGYPTASDSTPTLGSLIKAIEIQFNARTKVRNGIVELERRDYWQNITSNLVLPALNIQDSRQEEYTLNSDEIWKRYYIHYQTDLSDTHTLDFFDPTDAEYSTEPLNVINADLVSIKGLNDVSIPFALGVRKNNLNFIEKLAKEFFEIVDLIINTFGGSSNLTGLINNRIGVLQISQQFYTTTKMLYTVNGRQPENYPDLIKASTIYENYHSINEITINDYKIFSEVPLRITSSEFVNLLNNNYAEIDGVICEILTIKYFDEQSSALITYKRPFDYADGKVEIITIND